MEDSGATMFGKALCGLRLESIVSLGMGEGGFWFCLTSGLPPGCVLSLLDRRHVGNVSRELGFGFLPGGFSPGRRWGSRAPLLAAAGLPAGLPLLGLIPPGLPCHRGPLQ